MSVHLSKTLYIRVDRPLRADLLAAAAAAGQTVSAFARDHLRSAVPRRIDISAPSKAEPLTFAGTIYQRKER